MIPASDAILWSYLRSGDREHVAYRLIVEIEANRLWQIMRALERRLEQNGHLRPQAAGLELGTVQ